MNVRVVHRQGDAAGEANLCELVHEDLVLAEGVADHR
jgi:hypothetical protein